MNLRIARLLPVFLIAAGALSAAPKLRIGSATVGPVPVAVGQSGPTQTVPYSNAGDGTLNLTASVSATWLSASVTANTVNIALNTNTLAKGVYTGIVTLSDPNAVDAPQTIAVTAAVGGNVPDSLSVYVAPGGSSISTFNVTSNAPLGPTTRVQSPSGGPQLLLALSGNGSFVFNFPYQLTVTAPTTTAAGTYNGSFTISNAAFAADNKTVTVNVNVTTSPIATSSSIAFRIAQNTPKQSQAIAVANLGQGTLSVTGATPSTSSGGNWLTAAVSTGNIVTFTADPTGLQPGVYAGSVAVASNAANSVTVPVQLTVTAATGPTAAYRGVVDNATFHAGDTVAQGSIVAVFGEQFISGTPMSASSLPLGTSLGGATVNVNGKPAPIYYASYGQINFQIPYDATPGDAVVRVDNGSTKGNSVSVTIAPSASRILVFNNLPGNYGIIVNQDSTFPVPTSLGIGGHPAKVGDVLTIYCLGLGQTNPAVTSGTAAPGSEPLARVNNVSAINFGGGLYAATSTAFYTGLTPGFVGLYQINVAIPVGAPTGDNVLVFFSTPDGQSNRAAVSIQ